MPQHLSVTRTSGWQTDALRRTLAWASVREGHPTIRLCTAPTSDPLPSARRELQPLAEVTAVEF